jgi:hypothetical protein
VRGWWALSTGEASRDQWPRGRGSRGWYIPVCSAAMCECTNAAPRRCLPVMSSWCVCVVIMERREIGRSQMEVVSATRLLWLADAAAAVGAEQCGSEARVHACAHGCARREQLRCMLCMSSMCRMLGDVSR